ncbi:hypothetical protein DIPPA_05556 [Diplonema papillatum]|nr:hypothetical protein DIPPA_05556 [Diplonema papillatum]
MDSAGEKVGKEIIHGKLPKLEDIDLDGPPAYVELIRSCWSQRPQDRPTASEVVDSLVKLCGEFRCATSQCPPYSLEGDPYIDASSGDD